MSFSNSMCDRLQNKVRISLPFNFMARTRDTKPYKALLGHVLVLFRLILTQAANTKSNVFKLSITHLCTQRTVNVVVKTVPENSNLRVLSMISVYYENEKNFYTKICPKLKAFEKDHRVPKSCIPVPEYMTSCLTPGNEFIMLQDLNEEKFVMGRAKKNEPLDEDHFRLIFESYGRFHAISFCFKDSNELRELTTPLHKIRNNDLILMQLENIFRNIVTSVMQGLRQEQHLHQKLQTYLDDDKRIHDVVFKAGYYNELYGCLIHGSSNERNILFKYNAQTTQVEDLKIIDFSCVGYGTPVYDLADFFYSAAAESASHLDTLILYINLYYSSFSKTVKQFNKTPENLLPRRQLIDDWKKYSKISIIKAMNDLKQKYIEDKPVSYDSFNLHITNLLQHMYNYNIL